MGSVDSKYKSSIVLPEIIVHSSDSVLLVHGQESDKSFWWPPGAYWRAYGGCDLTVDSPEQWMERALQDQLAVQLEEARLSRVDFLRPDHPPVLTYLVRIAGTVVPSRELGFDGYDYFGIDSIPSPLGRDKQHAEWFRHLARELMTAR